MLIGMTKRAEKNLKQITDQYNLSQLVQEPTRIIKSSKTRIDLIFTNKAERINKTFNYLTGISDHNIIFFSRKLTKHRLGSPVRLKTCINSIPNNQQQSFAAALKRLDWRDISQCKDIEIGCNMFLTKINEVVESFTTRNSRRKRKEASLPWIDDECRSLLKRRDWLLKQSLNSGLATDRQKFTHVEIGQHSI